MKKKFNYNQKVWGRSVASLSPIDWSALKLKYALKSLEDIKGRVLEIGCGGGVFSRGIKYHRPDLEIYGLDISGRSINFAKKNSKGISFREGSIYKLSFQNKSFAAVLAFDVLEHLQEPAKALSEISRVLKDKGVFFSATPLEGSLLTIHGLLYKIFGFNLKEKQIGHVQKFSLKSLTNLFRDYGFEITDYKYCYHFFKEFLDIFYRGYLALTKRYLSEPDFSIEDYFINRNIGILEKISFSLYKITALMSNIMSFILRNWPGYTICITAVSGNKKEFDYEEKVYAGKEESRFKIFHPYKYADYPNELRQLKGRALEIGCGAGGYSDFLKRKNPGLRMYGSDISRNAIKMAKNEYPGIKFEVANAYKLPYPDNYFDLIILRHVLEHLDKPERVLSEAKRVLKVKGILYSATPAEGDPLVLSTTQGYAKKYHGHKQRFSRESLLKLIKKQGFRIKRYYFSGFIARQISEVLYYPLMELLHLPVNFSFGTYARTHKSNLSGYISRLLRKMVILIYNLEDLVIPSKVPGLFMHVISEK